MAVIKFGTYYNKSSLHKDDGTMNQGVSLTDESFRSMVEIDAFVYASGAKPVSPTRFDMENYETANWTFEDWQNERAKVERKFLHLTPEMQQYFGNAQNFLKYCSNPDNYELQKDGMVAKEDIPVNIPEIGGDNESNKNTSN